MSKTKLSSALPSLFFVFLFVLLTTGVVYASTLTVVEFPLKPWAGSPSAVARAQGSGVWFVESTFSNIQYVTKMGNDGTIGAEFPVLNGVNRMTMGSDGNLWFSQLGPYVGSGMIGKMSPTGSLTLYPLPSGLTDPTNIVWGPDGNLWLLEYATSSVVKFNSNGTVVGQYAIPGAPMPSTGSDINYLLSGPDGNLWFTEPTASKVARVSPQGSFSEFTVPLNGGFPSDLAVGADGNLWLIDYCSYTCTTNIARMTTGGAFTEFSVDPSVGNSLSQLVLASDGKLWSQITRQRDGLSFLRLALDGSQQIFDGPSYRQFLVGGDLIAASDGTLWYTVPTLGGRIGRFDPRTVPASTKPAYLPVIQKH